MATAAKTIKQGRSTYPSSFRFKERIHDRLNHYAKSLKRKKSSLVEEALEDFFDRAKQKEEEILEFRRLIQEGRESVNTGVMPSAEVLIKEARAKYNIA